MPESKTTVRVKSDAHPNGYIIVNAEDPRAKEQPKRPQRQEPEQDAPKRRRSTRRDG